MFKHDAAIIGCQKQIRDLMQKRENIDRQIAAHQQMLAALLKLKQATVGLSAQDLMQGTLPSEGLAEQCRRVLRLAQGYPLTPLQVKGELEKMGFDFSQYRSNPLSSIHTTLRRIADGQEFQQIMVLGQGAAYKWVRPTI